MKLSEELHAEHQKDADRMSVALARARQREGMPSAHEQRQAFWAEERRRDLRMHRKLAPPFTESDLKQPATAGDAAPSDRAQVGTLICSWGDKATPVDFERVTEYDSPSEAYAAFRDLRCHRNTAWAEFHSSAVVIYGFCSRLPVRKTWKQIGISREDRTGVLLKKRGRWRYSGPGWKSR